MTKTLLFLCSGNYYRSRYAEIVFNSLARAAGLGWVAVSAGLRPEHFALNSGPISASVLATARQRGFTVLEPARPPHAVTEQDLEAAHRIIAMKEVEHRRILEAQFPAWAARVVYWNMHDIDVAPPGEVLPIVELAVSDLVRELGGGPAAEPVARS